MNAGSAAQYGFFTYTVIGDKVTITDYPTDREGVVDIPSTIPETTGLPVTSIGANAFYGCSKLTSVTMPAGVVSIGSSAFYKCTALTSMTISDNVTSIGSFAFAFSGLTTVTIPAGATSIGSSAFYSCTALKSVTIPEGVTRIQSDVFNGCASLASVTIPLSVIVIEAYAFYGCTSLPSVVIPANVTSIGDWAFYGCAKQTGAYFMGNAPTHMGTSVFDANDSGFTVYYMTGKTGFTSPTWKGYQVAINDAPPYANWASVLAPSENGPNQTPKNDGVSNLMKFACNMDPSKPDVRRLTAGGREKQGLPCGSMVDGKLRVEFLRRKFISATNPGITYTLQFSSDLGASPWSEVNVTTTPLGASIDSTWERVVVDDALGGTIRVGRLKVMQTP